MRQILQKPVPYPDSLIWELHRRYFHQRGIAAWQSGEVPSGITSNRRAAYQNARIVPEALRDQQFDADETVYILEVGSGSGQFAINFLNGFHSICADESETFADRLHYMITDCALPNLEALSIHPGFIEYRERGAVGFYLYDVLKPQMPVRLDGSRFDPATRLFSAVIANYVHCALPMTIFRKKDGNYYEKYISIEMDGENDAETVKDAGDGVSLVANATEPGLMEKLNPVPSYASVQLDTHPTTPQIRQAVRSVASMLDPATIPVPVGTCLHLKGLQPFLKKNGICLISDKGFSDTKTMNGDKPFLPTIHGNSLAHQLNFPLIETFARNIGFSAVGTTDETHILKTILVVNAPEIPIPLAHRFGKLFVKENGNIDASDFVKAADDYFRDGKWKKAAVFYRKGLRLRENSPYLLFRLAKCWRKLDKPDEALDCCRQGKTADTSRNHDFDFEQGLILFRQKKYAEALKHYEASEIQFGGCKQGYYNMGLCWAGMNHMKKAHDAYKKAIEKDSGYKIAKNAIDNIKEEVFSDWLARASDPSGVEISESITTACCKAGTSEWKNHLLGADGFSVKGEKLFPANYSHTFYRCESEPLEPVCLDILQKFGIVHDNDDWGIYFPCGYDKVKDIFKQIRPQDPAQKIALVPGCNDIVSKTSLWTLLSEHYGRESATRLMPETFVLRYPKEMERFREYFREKTDKVPGTVFVLKNNYQRQKGLRLTRALSEIENAAHQDYLLVQEFLEDPLLINGRKINLRFYMCLTGWRGRMQLHIHRNGFVYYTRDTFEAHSLDFHRSITSGYVDRRIYRDHPLTHKDMVRWLAGCGRDPEHIFSLIDHLFRKTMNAVSSVLCLESAFDAYPKFQLFGADIALDSRLQPRLLEINKGPDLWVKGFRDRQVKEKVFLDLLDLVNIVDSPHSNEFRHIWDAAPCPGDPQPSIPKENGGSDRAGKELANE